MWKLQHTFVTALKMAILIQCGMVHKIVSYQINNNYWAKSKSLEPYATPSYESFDIKIWDSKWDLLLELLLTLRK